MSADAWWPCCEHCATPAHPHGNGDGHATACSSCQTGERKPYYADESVTLWHGDCREILPVLGITADVCVTDPPYGETSLAWDRWPKGWPALVAEVTSSLWCFGSMRMFIEQRDEFTGWRLSQDVVWRKPFGAGMATDRFRRVHEHALHWYKGDWSDCYHVPPREPSGVRYRVATASSARSEMYGGQVGGGTDYADDGSRLPLSVLDVRSMFRRGTHPTEKPTGILDPLITYACPPGGTVLDPFAGSGSTLDAARCSGRRAVGIEASEQYCEVIARRLSQGSLFGGAA